MAQLNTSLNIILKTLFWLSLVFISITILCFIIANSCDAEFRDPVLGEHFLDFMTIAFPASILSTLAGTIKKRQRIKTNGLRTFLTLVLAVFILWGIVAARMNSFSSWVNQTILFRNKANKEISINQQVMSLGALGSDGHRIVQVKPILKYFQSVEIVDTATLDKNKWVAVSELIISN